VIPAALRHRCGLRADDHVLLAASPGQDMLAAYSVAVVDQALRAHAPACGAQPGRHGLRADEDVTRSGTASALTCSESLQARSAQDY
jgi:hypothetical protein